MNHFDKMLFETILIIDSIPQHISWHQERLDWSYKKVFEKENTQLMLDRLINVPDNLRKGALRCRFMYNADSWTADFSIHIPRSITSLKIVPCDTIEYSCKFTDRDQLNALFEQRGEADDILIIRRGLVTDTSIANVLLYKDGVWFTPQEPILQGTGRARLLYEGVIRPAQIKAKELASYTHFMHINALNGFSSERAKPCNFI